MRTKIEVTPNDIKRGQIGQPWSCPIARAVRRALPRRFQSIAVYSDRVEYSILDHNEEAELPARPQGFIQRFDNKIDVKPFTFFLTVKDIR